MSQLIRRQQRFLLPRWRSPRDALAVGERDPRAGSSHNQMPDIDRQREVDRLRNEWRLNPTPAFTRSLLDGALVTDSFDSARDAARTILTEPVSAVTREIAQQVLGHQPEHEGIINRSVPIVARLRTPDATIAEMRKRLLMAPRDPLTWVMLARRHFVLGHDHQAERELKVAQSLAPHDRYVARAASRFYLHYDRLDEASAVLRRTRATVHDPWLLAVAILIAMKRTRSNRLIKRGMQLIKRQAFSPRAVSELATLIGMAERRHGKTRSTRKWFELALRDPTENVVAQMQFLRHPVERGGDWETRAHEAHAWWLLEAGDISRSSRALTEWQYDEPFSRDAALLGSWVHGTAMGDFGQALTDIRIARLACPEDPSLIAQEIYVRAELGDLAGAEDMLRNQLPLAIEKSGRRVTDDPWPILIAADWGMLCFRKGLREQGREFYRASVSLAQQKRNQKMALAAKWHSIREESRQWGLTAEMESEWQDLYAAMSNVQQIVYGRAMRRIGGGLAP